LAVAGDSWGFRMSDRDWRSIVSNEKPKSRQELRNWSTGCLCIDVDALQKEYEQKKQIKNLDYTIILKWVVTGGKNARSEKQRKKGYEPPLSDTEKMSECERCPGLGPSQIKNQLRRRGLVVSIKSVRRVMIEKNGYKTAPMKKAQEPAIRRFEADRPRELVQLDILEFYVHKVKVFLLLCL